jgi:Bacterial Ig-like domain (group 2)
VDSTFGLFIAVGADGHTDAVGGQLVIYKSGIGRDRRLQAIVACVFFVAGLLATSGCGGGGSNGAMTPPSLSSLAITPGNPSIGAGQNQQFKVEGTFSDGSKQDLTSSASWTSSNTAVATINGSGMAVGVAQGNSKIGAASGSMSTSVVLTVGPPSVISIAVTPSNALVVLGAPVQFTATGTFNDGSTHDVTSAATWSSSNTNFATVSLTGLVIGVANGGLTISAEASAVTGSDAVTVATSTGLPSGIGWHALPSNTVLQASGACPGNNFGGDPFLFADSCGNVIRAWSGAIADTTANRLLIWGGGSNNYYGNEIYSLNLGDNPITLTRLKDPTVPTNYSNSENCVESIPPGTSDFAPNSRGSYGGMAFLPGADVMYILNGSLGCQQGHGSTATWAISLHNLSNASSWVHEDATLTGPKPGSNGGAAFGNVAAYDPNSGLVFVNDALAIYTYSYQTNTYALSTTPQGFLTGIYLSGAIDPTRKLFVLAGGCSGGTCGPGAGVFVADISNPASTFQQDWTAATLADPICAEFLSGGANPINFGNPGFVFDSLANDFVAWPNQGNSVYILTPDTANQRLTCQKQTFANGPPNSAQGATGANSSNGTYGRFQYFPGPDVFVLVNDWNIPAYVLRLR